MRHDEVLENAQRCPLPAARCPLPAARCPLTRAIVDTLEERRLLSSGINVVGPGEHLQWDTGPQTINYTFDDFALVTDPAVQLTNITTGADATGWLTRTSADETTSLDYRVDHNDQDGIAHAFDRGNYDLVLSADQVRSDDDFTNLPGDVQSAFFFQPGDANHDRTVNNVDYWIFADSNGTLSGATYAQADFNYDGAVGQPDGLLLQRWWGTTLQPPPTAPNTVNASGGPNLIDLQWTIPEGTPNPDGFGLWRSTDGNVTWQFYQQINDGAARSFRDTGLLDGTKYGYRVRAWTAAAGYSETSNPTWAVTSLPGPTTAPVVSNIKTHAVTLAWDDNTTNEAGFFITVTAPDSTQFILDVPAHEGAGQQTFEVTGLSPNTQYSFEVQAYTDAQVSAPSPAAMATTAAPSVPGTPTNLSATGGTGQVQLSWSQPSNAVDLDEYDIERSTDGGETFELYDSIYDDSATSWTDTEVADGTSYMYRLTALSWEAGASITTDPVTATTDMPGPVNPPVVSLLGSSSLTLSWDDVTTDETGFEISALDGNHAYTETVFQAPAHDGTGQQTFTLTGLEPSDEYILYVRAKTDVKISADSDYADVDTLASGVPNPPSNLIATSVDWQSVALSWQDNSTDENGFTIQQLGADGVWTTIGTTAADITNYTVSSGITSSTDYDFRVLADGAGGSSGTGDFGGGGDSGQGGGGSGGDASQDDGSGTDGGPGGSDNYASVTSQEAFGDVFWRDGGNDHVVLPMARQWEGGENWDDGDAMRGVGQSPMTLQLTGLPAHGALVLTGIYDYSANPNADWKVDVDGTPLSDVAQLNTGVLISHTGTTASIQITPLQDNDGYWTIPDLDVQMDTPQINVGSATVDIGDDEEVSVTTADHGLMVGQGIQAWPDDVTLSAQVEGDSVSAGGTVTVPGGGGVGQLLVHGIVEGISTLVLKDASKGARGEAKAQVPAVNIAILSVPTLYPGQDPQLPNSMAEIALYDRFGLPMKGKAIQVKSSDPTQVKVSWNTLITDKDGFVSVFLQALKVSNRNKPVTLIAQYNKAKDEAPLDVHPIFLSVDKQQVTVAATGKTSVTVTATSGGHPLSGIDLTTALLPDIIPVTGSAWTDANGHAVISIGGTLFGATNPGEAKLVIRTDGGDDTPGSMVGVLVTVTK